MATHLKDVMVVTGTYTDSSGQEKKRYKNVGRLLRNDNGEFLVIERTFNPAGIPGDGDVFLSLFEPKAKESASRAPAPSLGDEIPY